GLMEGRISPAPGQEQFAQFFIDIVGYSYVRSVHLEVFRLYIHLLFGDPGIPRSIPAFLAAKYCPQKLEETYMQKRQEEMTKHYSDVKEKRRGTSEQKPDEAYTQWMQWSLDKELMKYREGEITLGFGIRPFIKVKKDVDSFDKSWYKNKYNKEPPTHYYMPLPDLLPRILKADEIEIVKNICYN